MAKKVPPEELSKTKTDFDAPKSLEQIKKNMDAMELGILENFLAGALTSEQEKSFMKRHPDLKAYAPKKTAAKKTPAKTKTGAKKKTPEQKKKEKEEKGKPTPPPAPPVAPISKRGGGRPGAFEKVQILTLKLPPEDVVKLKVKAAEEGKTVAQVVHDWLIQLS